MKNSNLELALVGFNYKNTEISKREKLSVSSTEHDSVCQFLKHKFGLRDLLILSTCNRLEIYYLASKIINKELLDAFCEYKAVKFSSEDSYLQYGSDALTHLWRVACGFDSLVIGEAQILGQIKTASRLSSLTQPNSPFFQQIMDATFRVAKKVRSETGIAKQSLSLGKLAVNLAKQIMGDLNKHSVLMIGAGSVGVSVINYLKDSGVENLVIVNRSLSKAAKLAQKTNAELMSFELLDKAMLNADIVIASVDVRDYILTAPQILKLSQMRRYRPLFIIDLGLPRNIDPGVSEIDNCYLFNIDNLENLAKENENIKRQEFDKCEQIIASELQKFNSNLLVKSAAKEVARFRQAYKLKFFKAIEAELAALELKPDDKQKLESILHRHLQKILHKPTQYLSRNPDSAYLLSQIFELELALEPKVSNIIDIKLAKSN